MATDNFDSFAETCERFGNIAQYDAAHLDVVGAFRRLAELHERELAAKDAEIAKLNAKCKEYERQPELMAETAREALRTLQEQDAEIAELRELLIELANAANTAFDDIAKCGSIIADGDVRDAAYRTHLMERIAKYRKALKGVNK